ncbi:MAG: hypothetical protein JJU15_19410 [Pararhodobacter sp.]|nr:hypothetical protein [Pararhodobacter sp.]
MAPGLKPLPERRFKRTRAAPAVQHRVRVVAFLEPAAHDLVAIPPVVARIDQFAARLCGKAADVLRRGQSRNQRICRDRLGPQAINATEFCHLDEARGRGRTIRQRHGQAAFKPGHGHPDGAGLVADASDQRLLLGCRVAGHGTGILDAVNATPKVIRSVTINKSPALFSVPAPSAEQLRRAEAIANAPEFRTRVGQALAARFPEDPAAPTPPVEKQIYGGFYSHADKALLAEFQRVYWRRRQEIVATLEDLRLRQLGRRLVAFHAPEMLSAGECGQYQAWLRERWSAPDVPETKWTSSDRARSALADIRGDGGIDLRLVSEIELYLQRFEASDG